ncbi:MoaD/ThiS family protein [Falsiroseomonas oryzae]|uniref:MoaD/ThiS family protein n=1 Tax=Falsiroseomonas oryzae TaxID=2766473 RepID=UPI0022EADB0D|nr:MoaD/ThiS family protein [Roseomonas sp. MO-31]
MPRIAFTPNLRRHLACPPGEVGGATLRAALDEVFAANPRLRGYLLDEHGRLRKHVAVFVNGEPVGDRAALSDSLAPGDEVFVFQALSGG